MWGVRGSASLSGTRASPGGVGCLLKNSIEKEIRSLAQPFPAFLDGAEAGGADTEGLGNGKNGVTLIPVLPVLRTLCISGPLLPPLLLALK